ncbi:zinc finger, CCHC-type containing protein [Tanacetum coccineum]|uniref:Zinc finger, CCHC-type containing protein n=2 Tax=Tanacetum coccineum TaxID=301880 RepID=A0ABQ5D7I4_9ASTR
MAGGSIVKEMTTNFEKLDKFEGHDFRRWQKKMHFLLTTLKVVYVLSTPMPELLEDDTVEAIRRISKWESDDYICRGHILNGMSDPLFDIYQNMEFAKELWDSLESKYMTEDASSKKFLDFKHSLKHGKDDMSLVQLGSHLRIEESLKAQKSDKGKGKEVVGPSCGKTSHFKKDCRSGNKKNNAIASGSGKGSKDQSQDQVDAIAWWIDSGATTHVCKDRCWFKTYEPVEDGSVFHMGDDHFALIHGKGSVVLEFNSGKSITLFNMLYIPKLRKNLISGPVLNKCGYKQLYESNKYITSVGLAADMRKEMTDYLTLRSETYVAEFILSENASNIEISEHPYDIILNLIDDFASSKTNMFSRVSEWVLSDRREDRIDDFVQEMENYQKNKKKCSDYVMRREMDRHCVTICPMKLVNCAYYTVGCKSSIPRCNVQQHNADELSSHLLYIIRSAHKEAAEGDLKHRLSNIEKLTRARDARALTFLIKDAESKLGPLEVNTKPNTSESVELPTGEDNNKTESPTKTVPPVVNDSSDSPNKNETSSSTEKTAIPEEDTKLPTKEVQPANADSSVKTEEGKDEEGPSSLPKEEHTESPFKKEVSKDLQEDKSKGIEAKETEKSGSPIKGTLEEQSQREKEDTIWPQTEEKVVEPIKSPKKETARETSVSDQVESKKSPPKEEKSKPLSSSNEEDTKKSPKEESIGDEKELKKSPQKEKVDASSQQRVKTHDSSSDEEEMMSPSEIYHDS